MFHCIRCDRWVWWPFTALYCKTCETALKWERYEMWCALVRGLAKVAAENDWTTKKT
jgi:hypothetical protein